MKNAILYYYQLSSYDIRKVDGIYFFKSSMYDYALVPSKTPYKLLEELNDLNVKLINSGIVTNELIYNKGNMLVTNIDNNDYVLMRYYKGKEQIININNIINFSNETLKLNLKGKLKWKKLWIDKIDYMEYQITHFGKKNPKIRESFSYYVGLGENAISLINDVGENIIFSVQHTRTGFNDNLFELYNPLNYVVDSRVRDICEYMKNKFFYMKNLSVNNFIMEAEQFIYNQKFSRDEYILFLSRLMFPTYYFDLYEQIVVGYKEEKTIYKIIDRVNDYELFLKHIYMYMCNIINMPDIEWLKK